MEDKKVYRVPGDDLSAIASAIREMHNSDEKLTTDKMPERIRAIRTPIPEGWLKPEGVKEIAENGEYNIAEYEGVNVNVPIPEGYVKPEGTLEVVEGGEYDVVNYEKVDVNITVENLTAIIDEQESLINELIAILETKSGAEDLRAIIAEQEELIKELNALLDSKMDAGR